MAQQAPPLRLKVPPDPNAPPRHFVLATEKGDLILCDLSPHGYTEISRTHLLNPTNVPEYEACARTGVGVFETLKAVATQVLTERKKGGG